MFRKAICLAAILLVATAVPAIAPGKSSNAALKSQSDDKGHPACKPGDVVDNDDVRIWFHGAKGQLKVFKKNNSSEGNDGMYQYKTLEVTETNSSNETIASLNLERAAPQTSSCTVEESGQWVNVTYQVTQTVRTTADDGPDDQTAQVDFIYHFNKTSASAKFDLNVTQWPWHDDGQRLDYDFEVTSGEWVIEPAENGLGFRDADDGEAEAHLTWAPNATAHYDDGHNETAIVNSTVTGSDHHVDVELRFTQASPGYKKLVYDPTVGIGPYLILAGILVPLNPVPAPVQELATTLV